VGNWRDDNQDTVFIERWKLDADGHLEGYAESRSSDGDKIYLNEHLRLEQRGSEVIYVADVSNREDLVEFRMVTCTAESIVFENPEHDFPKRIEYRFPGPDQLSAHITDMEEKGFDLDFKRQP
jgi:hypothetical protein